MRTKLTCVDTEKLDASFAGREFDESLLSARPDGIDPCGGKGEFHSFVYAGPMLRIDFPVSVGESVVRDQFVFADLSPPRLGYPFVPIALTKLYCSCSPEASGPVIAAVASSGY